MYGGPCRRPVSSPAIDSRLAQDGRYAARGDSPWINLVAHVRVEVTVVIRRLHQLLPARDVRLPQNQVVGEMAILRQSSGSHGRLWLGVYSVGDMRKRVRVVALVLTIICLVALAIAARPHFSRNAIQLFAERNCACGEFHEEVTGLIVLNPLRERTPEMIAARFLSDLKDGKCAATVPPLVCQQGLTNSRPVLDWKLRNRSDANGKVSLFYYVKGKYRNDVDTYPHDAWGEGIVQVEQMGNSWKVYGYGAYY